MNYRLFSFRRIQRAVISLLLLSLFFVLPFCPPAKAETALRTVSRNETVEHLFTHCLIAHPDIAFREGNEYGIHLDRDCLTPIEFRKILDVLYRKNYALVDIHKTFRITDSGAERTEFEFPKDKKPLILSFDDVVYASKNLGKGMAEKLVLDENNEIFAYTKEAKPSVHSEEFAPILEDFIKKHPDFSFQNARGTIFLTGFDGILGYRTQRNSLNCASETEKAKKVVSTLKEKGWTFGSHSYAHAHMKKYTPEQMRDDIQKWKREVEPLVGKVTVYAYPYGEWVIEKDGRDEREKALIQAGFKLFCGVGENPFYTKMPLGDSSVKVLFQDRLALDGVSLRTGKCERLFSAKEIYDNRRPISYP